MSAISPRFQALDPDYSTIACNVKSLIQDVLKLIPQYHFYPAAELDKLLGKYTLKELTWIYQIYHEVGENIFIRDFPTPNCLDYIEIVGDVKVGKSSMIDYLEKRLGAEPFNPRTRYAYLDVDLGYLLRMNSLHQEGDLSEQKTYDYWKEAVHFLRHLHLAVALEKGCAIIHNAMSLTPHATTALESIRAQYCYVVTMIHVTCDQDVYQTLEGAGQKKQPDYSALEECKNGQSFLHGQLPNYLRHAYRMFFYYREDMQTIFLVAKIEYQDLEVYHEAAWARIRAIHDQTQGEGFWDRAYAEHLNRGSELGTQKV